jgi:hypothetical protein
VKVNLQPHGTGRAFRIIDGRLVWERDPVLFTADELQHLAASGLATQDRKAEVADWLQRLLAPGRRPAQEIQDLALAAQVPYKLLWAAKKQVHVKAVRDGHEQRWYWELTPEQKPWYDGLLWDCEPDGTPLVPN